MPSHRRCASGATGGAGPPAVAFLYADGRGSQDAATHLDGFSGLLQVDGCAAYRGLAAPDRSGGPVTLAFCWSHARRRFHEIARAGHAPVAEEALRRIAALYAVETDIRGLDPEARRAARDARSSPIVKDLRPWLEDQGARLPGKSRLAEAIRCTLKLWDGRVELDTNLVEREIRPVALIPARESFDSAEGFPPGLIRDSLPRSRETEARWVERSRSGTI